MFLVAVVATVTGATITLYEAYEKYYVRPAQEVEPSRLKKENAELREERDLLKKENANLKEEGSSERASRPNGAELARRRERLGVIRKQTESSDRLHKRETDERDKDKRGEDAR
jgi:cell division protein FtsB